MSNLLGYHRLELLGLCVQIAKLQIEKHELQPIWECIISINSPYQLPNTASYQLTRILVGFKWHSTRITLVFPQSLSIVRVKKSFTFKERKIGFWVAEASEKCEKFALNYLESRREHCKDTRNAAASPTTHIAVDLCWLLSWFLVLHLVVLTTSTKLDFSSLNSLKDGFLELVGGWVHQNNL